MTHVVMLALYAALMAVSLLLLGLGTTVVIGLVVVVGWLWVASHDTGQHRPQ